MIKHGIPHCDVCGAELKHAADEETHYGEDEQHGFYFTHAVKHYCEDCSDELMDKAGYPPCGECETHPCERGRDCWASPPLHLFPYETFYSQKATRLTGNETKLDQFKGAVM